MDADPKTNASPTFATQVAATNNARWCAAVWRAHGLAAEYAPGLWFTRAQVPAFYPNAVTADATATAAAQMPVIAQLAGAGASVAVKDSFACLPLHTIGFRPLFDATWLWRGAGVVSSEATGWQRLQGTDAIGRWLVAWCSHGGGRTGVLPACLGEDRSVSFFAREDGEGAIVDGVVAYDCGQAIGLTNLFGSAAGLTAALEQHFGPRPIACYETAAGVLAMALEGFAEVGTLRVWTHSDP